MNKKNLTPEQVAFNILKITLDNNSPSRPCLKCLQYDLQDANLKRAVRYCCDHDCDKHYEDVKEFIERLK